MPVFPITHLLQSTKTRSVNILRKRRRLIPHDTPINTAVNPAWTLCTPCSKNPAYRFLIGGLKLMKCRQSCKIALLLRNTLHKLELCCFYFCFLASVSACLGCAFIVLAWRTCLTNLKPGGLRIPIIRFCQVRSDRYGT